MLSETQELAPSHQQTANLQNALDVIKSEFASKSSIDLDDRSYFQINAMQIQGIKPVKKKNFCQTTILLGD